MLKTILVGAAAGAATMYVYAALAPRVSSSPGGQYAVALAGGGLTAVLAGIVAHKVL